MITRRSFNYLKLKLNIKFGNLLLYNYNIRHFGLRNNNINNEENKAKDLKRMEIVKNKVNSMLENSKCEGCGSVLQFLNEEEEGFISFKLFEKLVDENTFKDEDYDKNINTLIQKLYINKIKSYHTDNQDTKQSHNVNILENSIPEMEAETLEPQLWEINNQKKPVYCKRCVLLRQNNIPEAIKIKTSITTMPRESLTLSIFKRIPLSSYAILVFDCLNIKGSMPHDFINHIKNKNLKPIYVINKIDILPNGIILSKLKSQIISEIKEIDAYFSDVSANNLFLISAKNNFGFSTLIKYLKNIRPLVKEEKGAAKLYLIGLTNTGKSSIINKLFENVKKNYVKNKYSDPFQKDLNIKLKNNIFQSDITFDKKVELTVSTVPCTTLHMHGVRIPSINFKVYDTPGVLSNNQLSTVIENEKTLKNALNSKKIKRLKVKIGPGFTLIIGGLAYLTVNLGKSMYVILNFSSKVSFHVTSTHKVEPLLEKHYGKLFYPTYCDNYEASIFEKKEFILNFKKSEFGKCYKEDLFIGDFGYLSFFQLNNEDHAINFDLSYNKHLEPMLKPALSRNFNVREIPIIRRKILKTLIK